MSRILSLLLLMSLAAPAWAEGGFASPEPSSSTTAPAVEEIVGPVPGGYWG